MPSTGYRVPGTLKMMLIHVIIFILTGIGYPASKHSTNYSTSTIQMTIGWSALHRMEIESFFTVYEIQEHNIEWSVWNRMPQNENLHIQNDGTMKKQKKYWTNEERKRKTNENNRYVKREVKKRRKWMNT